MLLLGRGSLCALFFPSLYAFGDFVFFCLQLFFLYSIPVFRFFSSSYLCLFGFVPVLLLPRLPLLCLVVGSSGCVSSYGFVVGGSSYFIFLCFGCFLLDFFRGFTSCFRFLVLFSSWQGFTAVWLYRRGKSFS